MSSVLDIIEVGEMRGPHLGENLLREKDLGTGETIREVEEETTLSF